MKITDLSKAQKYDFCIKLVSVLKEYLKDDKESSFVTDGLDSCKAWNKVHSLDIAAELYDYLDGEEQSLALYEELEEDERKRALWNCIIDSIAYICRGAFEEEGAKYFPEPIESVDENLFVHIEESFLKFGGSRVEFDSIVSDCSGS